MDEAYHRWRPPKSRSSFRRCALVFIGYVCHRFRRAFVRLKSSGAVMLANPSLIPLLLVLARVPVMLPEPAGKKYVATIIVKSLSPLSLVPVMLPVSTIVLSPLIVVPSITVSLTLI